MVSAQLLKRLGELMSDKSPIILALDVDDINSAFSLVEQTLNSISIYKLGLESISHMGNLEFPKSLSVFPKSIYS